MSYLIVGGKTEERLIKANEMSDVMYHISKFDTINITGESSIGIAQIRELEHNLSLKPINSKEKSAIIHPAELLTIESQNALLKTLEEAEDTIIILTAPQTDSLLPTIASRCQIIKLSSKSEIIDEKTFNTFCLLLNTLLRSGVGERLKIVSAVGKEREIVKDWLIKMTYVCRKIMLDKSSSLNSKDLVQIIRTLEKTRSLVEQNINSRLALEICLLDLPS